MNAVRYRVKADDGRYVESLAKGTYVAKAWTVYESAARSFGYTVALAVATRNAAHVVAAVAPGPAPVNVPVECPHGVLWPARCSDCEHDDDPY